MKKMLIIDIQTILMLSLILFSANLIIKTEPTYLWSHTSKKIPQEQPKFQVQRIDDEIEEFKPQMQKSKSITTSLRVLNTQYDNHSPINISGNADFHAQAITEQWPGNGTSINPYLIEGYNITNIDYVRNIISIQNTDVYFKIINCLLRGYPLHSCWGIVFDNVQNGQILNNYISCYRWGGIELSNHSVNNIIMNNFLEDSHVGITISDSAYNSLINNTLVKLDTSTSMSFAMNIYDSEHTILVNNTLIGFTTLGISLYNSSYSIFINNSIFNSIVSIFLDSSSSECIIINNTMTSGPLSLGSSKNNIISKNNFFNTELHLFESGNNTITNNNFTNASLAIHGSELRACLQAEVRNNSINGKPLVFWQNISGGIVPKNAEQVILINCAFIEISDLFPLGIIGIFSSNLDIHNNIIDRKVDRGFIVESYGIHLKFSQNNTLSNNTISSHIPHNQLRIGLTNSGNNTLVNNTLLSSVITLSESGDNIIINNTLSDSCLRSIASYEGAISLVDSTCNILKNNIIKNSFPSDGQYSNGVNFFHSDNNILTSNTITDNSGDGIGIHSSGNITITSNIVTNNAYGIRIFEGSYDIKVKNNVFAGNGIDDSQSQAFDQGSNNHFFLNYWADWISPDINGDGIVDNPYPIDGEAQNFDYNPRVDPNIIEPHPHLLIAPKIILPTGGEVQSDTLLISWIPAIDSREHSISYSVFYSIDNATTWNLIVSQLTGTDYSWDLSPIESGFLFLIKVVATCSEGLSAFDVTYNPLFIPSKKTTALPFEAIFLIMFIGLGRRKKKLRRSKTNNKTNVLESY
jgi:parallel beta-helix repeat protein